MEWWMNREKYGVVNTENLLATQWGAHIFSVVDAGKDVENGHFGFIGDTLPGERELCEFITPDATNITQNRAVLIATPATIYFGATPEQFQEHYFINRAGQSMRAFALHEKDWFGITEYTIDALVPFDPDTNTGGVVEGNLVVLQADSNRLREIAPASLAGDEVFIGEIQDVDSSPLRPFIMPLGKRPARMIGIRVRRNHV